MIIDLTTVMNKRCDKLDFDYEFKVEDVECDILLPDDMTITKPVRVKGFVADNNNCMTLTADVTAEYLTSCDRCLDDVIGTLTFPFERMISTDEAPASFEDDEGSDDIVYVNESGVFVDDAIIEELALELPVYHLCDDDCPGLCQRCGKKLADGPCGCEEIKEIDPRLKKLQKLLDNFE